MGEENHDPNLLINLCKDKIFKFECTVENEKIKLALREINNNSPDYYEAYYTLEDFYNMKDFFKTYSNLNEIQQNLLALFKSGRAKLVSSENGAKIELLFKVVVLADDVIFVFCLDKKKV